MTAAWMDAAYRHVRAAVVAFKSGATDADEVDAAIIDALRRVASDALTVAQDVATEKKAEAEAMRDGVSRVEEKELHRRRAIDAGRIAQTIATLRANVVDGNDISDMIGALRAAVGGEDVLDEELPDDGTADDPASVLEVAAVEQSRARAFDVGKHELVLRTGVLSIDEPCDLTSTAAVSLSISAPVRVTRVVDDYKGGGRHTRIEAMAAAVVVVGGVPIE